MRNLRKAITLSRATSTRAGGVEAWQSGKEPEVQMVHSVYSKSMSQHQISLLEHALREISKIEPVGWDAIPTNLHPSFARYMGADVWTGLTDLMNLREAALMIIRDAITRSGEFTDDD